MNNQLFKTAFYIFNKYAAIEELTENEVSKNHAILVNIFNDINKVFDKTTNRTDDSDLIFELRAEIVRKYDACVFSKDFSKISYEKGKRQDGSSDRAFTSVGKFIKNKTTVGKNINDSLLKEICQLYNTEVSKYKTITNNDYTSLSGDDVANKYKEYGLKKKDNTNAEVSCMTGKPDLVQLYALNSDKVQLLTLKNAPVRCLLWTCDDGAKVLDRIYPAQNNHIPRIIDWAKQNGILYRQNHDGLCTDSVIELSDGSTRTVTLENLPEKYPYIDTFCYGRFNQDGSLTLSNSQNIGKITFHYTDGTFEGKDEYSPTFNVCENCGTSVDPDDSPTVNGNIYCEQCYFDLFFECMECYETFSIDEVNCVNDNKYCNYCYKKIILKCWECDKILGIRGEDDNDAIFDDDGDAFCGICYFERYIRCDCCDVEIYAKDHNKWVINADKETMCIDCYYKRYFKCHGCDEEFSIKKSNELGDELYCNDCFENAKNQTDTNETNG